MILFFILIFFIFGFLTLKIEVNIKNICLNTKLKEKIKKDYEIDLKFKIFKVITISKIRINSRRIKDILNKPKIKSRLKENRLKLLKNSFIINENLIDTLKKVKININEIYINLELGTENAAVTALIIPFISTILAILLRNKIDKFDDKKEIKILPIYYNQNSIRFEFSAIFQIKLIHIIYVIYILSADKKIEKYHKKSDKSSYIHSCK